MLNCEFNNIQEHIEIRIGKAKSKRIAAKKRLDITDSLIHGDTINELLMLSIWLSRNIKISDL